MRTIGTKFVTFYQNNSGGYYLIDDNVKHYVIIEGYDLWQIGMNRSSHHFNKILKGWRDGETKMDISIEANSKWLWLMENSDRMFWISLDLCVINMILSYVSNKF